VPSSPPSGQWQDEDYNEVTQHGGVREGTRLEPVVGPIKADAVVAARPQRAGIGVTGLVHRTSNPLLRARRDRPRRRAAEKRDELAPPDHSITSSARASSVGGTWRPSVLAVCMLMTSSNLVDCTTGRSAGFAPLRMRPVYMPT
jgi:hypothetical protein